MTPNCVLKALFGALLVYWPSMLGALTTEDLSLLDAELTPVGAERAGNTAGTIPPWTGGLPQQPMDAEAGYVDPYAEDPVLFSITAENLESYAASLSEGQRALLKQYPETFKINVYPTRRSANWPAEVLSDVRAWAPLAKSSGDSVQDVGSSAVPFPITLDPRQMMWNHVLRWRGGSLAREYSWFPVTRGGRFFEVRILEWQVSDQHGYMQEGSSRPNRLINTLAAYLAPASLEGQMSLFLEPINREHEPRKSWGFNPNSRRVLRLPGKGYDDMDPRTLGLRTADQFDGWNGSPDRYDWQLLGKREMYIPYNSYSLISKALNYEDMLQPGHFNPGLLRYELHRVWVIEATLRRGKHHRYRRRVFYLDEDTWQVAMEDVYDRDGQLWRYAEHPMMQYYDVMVPGYAAHLNYDLMAGAYLASELENESSSERKWGWKGHINDFLPGNIRRLGTR